jgi:hypothetical protein
MELERQFTSFRAIWGAAVDGERNGIPFVWEIAVVYSTSALVYQLACTPSQVLSLFQVFFLFIY